MRPEHKEKVKRALQSLGHDEDPEYVASLMDDMFHQYNKDELIGIALMAAREEMIETWVDMTVDVIRHMDEEDE